MSGLSDAAVTRLRTLGRWPEFESGRYSVTEEIGRGGMGTVYLATDEELGREVAIKIPNALASAELEARLQREARVLARLEHPGIVPIHDLGRLADGRLFYVMKRVKGHTLREHVHTVTDESERLRLFERILEPVAFAHAQGVIHRDLTPANIMVGQFGEVMVMDWGIAMRVEVDSVDGRRSAVDGQTVDVDSVDGRRSAVDGQTVDGQAVDGRRSSVDGQTVDGQAVDGQTVDGQTVDGRRSTVDGRESAALVSQIRRRHSGEAHTTGDAIVGTVGFMAPEQARAGASVDQRADVYSLGGILYFLFTANDPVPDADGFGQLRQRGVPRPLAAICARALAKDPRDRYQTVAELAADVAAYRSGRAVSAYRETAFERAARFGRTHRTAILLVVAYMVMRAVVAVVAGR